MPDEGFKPGPVPAVQPEDIRTAYGILEPRRRSGQQGLFGDPRLQAGCDPSSDLAAVITRTTILLVALDQGIMLRDAFFQVAAKYPITCREDQNFDLDMPSFIAALEASG